MNTNFIGQNIKYLVGKENLSMDAFGRLFGLNRGSIGAYIENRAGPKIETLQKVCERYSFKLDDIVNGDVSNLKPEADKEIFNNKNLFDISNIDTLEKMSLALENQRQIIYEQTIEIHKLKKENGRLVSMLS
jgi:transcriptional regulator with XRE-family HTH domain